MISIHCDRCGGKIKTLRRVDEGVLKSVEQQTWLCDACDKLDKKYRTDFNDLMKKARESLEKQIREWDVKFNKMIASFTEEE